MSSNRTGFALAGRPLRAAATLSAAALCLAACASDPASPAHTARNSVELYPLHTELMPDEVALAVHAQGLSPAQVQALTGFAARWRQEGQAAVSVQAPHGAADPALAARAQAQARDLLASLGVPAAAIRLGAYEAADPKAPLLLSMSRRQAAVAACGRAWDDLTSTEDNVVQSNFGCAVSANMAAQIAYPADIAHPRGEDAPDADRRTTVMSLYAAGKTTAAADDSAKSGYVSRAVP
ncbi:MAG: pilus assembly protein CpaD [Caulobacteraceae bacterium]|nr:pilus assembly protein CpaD [Caulobacteraceae bacterium]